MSRFKSFAFGSKRRTVVSVLALLALTAGAAIAAFIIYTGVTGSGSAQVQQAQTFGAIALTQTSAATLQVGTRTEQTYNAHNSDTGAAHQVNSVSGSITTSPAECAASITFDGGDLVGRTIAPNDDFTAHLGWTVAANIPTQCAGATVNVAITGSTTP
jgi:hypothetical protein